MGRIKETLNESTLEARSSLKTLIKGNANLFTAFAAIFVLVAGAGIVQGRATWWVSGITIAVGFTLLFFLLNARVVIKFLIALLSLLFSANFALQLGVLASPTLNVSMAWMATQILVFFTCLTVSYLTLGHKSRWTGITLALWFNFLLTVALLAVMTLQLGLTVSVLISTLMFFSYFRLTGLYLEKRRKMPVATQDNNHGLALASQAEKEGWSLRVLPEKKLFKRTGRENFLVWNETRAFVLKPVTLENKFALDPHRKKARLSHNGHSINPWLLNLVHNSLPLWRARNANMMLVLLDVTNKNGNVPQAIGVAVPDSKKKVPVGIYPAKNILKMAKKDNGFFTDLESHYGDYLRDLTARQKKALEEFTVTDPTVETAD